MPEDVEAVIAALFDQLSRGTPNRRPRSFRRLDAGVVGLDLGEEDHVFEVAVERVPRRRWRPDRPVGLGAVSGMEAELVGVVVDSFVHVHLIAAPGEERDRLGREYADDFERWAAVAAKERGALPEEPAGRLMRVAIRISDSVGTAYVPSGSQYGGTGTEWEAIQMFRPRPPAAVRELELVLEAPGSPAVAVSVPLP